MSTPFSSALFVALILKLCVVLISGQPSVQQPLPINFQVIDPSGLVNNPVLFGSGLALTQNGRGLAVVGFDQATQRQFLATYSTANATSYFGITNSDGVASLLGDSVTVNTIYPGGDPSAPANQSGWYVTPICISQDAGMQFIAFGYRYDGFNSQGSVVIAAKQSDEVAYTVQARLYSDTNPPTASLFPFDMACSKDLSTIYVTETSPTTEEFQFQPFVRLTVYQRTANAWTILRTEDYLNGTDTTNAPVALLEPDETFYAVRGTWPSLIYVRNATDGSLNATVDVSSLNVTVRQLAITNHGKRLLVGDFIKGVFIVIDYNDQLKAFDVSGSRSLSSPLVPSSSSYGFTLAVSSNSSVNAGLVAGIPDANGQLGAALTWKPLYNPANNSYIWVSNSALLNPFGPNLPSQTRFGGSLLSHNLLSADESILVLSGPGTGFNSSGLVFVLRNPFASILPVPPVAPPQTVTPAQAPTLPTNTGTYLIFLILVVAAIVAGLCAFFWIIWVQCCATTKTIIVRDANM